MKLSDFDYHLPKELIAQEPAAKREQSRLLVFDRSTKRITDAVFSDIDSFLVKDSTITVNNSKVQKCRIVFDKNELFVTEQLPNNEIIAMVRPGKRFREGMTVGIVDDVSATVLSVLEDGRRRLRLSAPIDDSRLEALKQTPFPPYIKTTEALAERYQTVYAKHFGSMAAPTAGLHFSDQLLADLQQAHPFAEVTLHVGLGTFAPISDEQIANKTLHSESVEITPENAELLNSAQHITAVGTTTARTLESLVQGAGSDRSFPAVEGDETSIFIQPGYEFKAVDSLITNFHLPKSSLLMMISAFMGYDEMKMVYEHAVSNKYRFFSFGDGMLIL